MPDFQLAVARYRFTFRAETPVRFPAYAGSTWRGAFGNALRRTVCITREPECKGCLLWRSCVYSQVFETPAGQEPLLGKINAAPHPYILHPLATSGKHYAAGEHFTLRLTLLGKSIEHLPYLIHALQQAGERGLGKRDGNLSLQQVEQENAPGSDGWQRIHTPGGNLQALPGGIPAVPPLPPQVWIEFRTPYRSVHDGKLVRSGRFAFQPFISTLMRRISLLHVYHAGVELAADYPQLTQQAAAIPLLEPDLRWHEWARYSSRQQSKVQMGGLLGGFGLPVEALEPYWAWLWLGQWVNTGKGAVMGMGEYRLNCA